MAQKNEQLLSDNPVPIIHPIQNQIPAQQPKIPTLDKKWSHGSLL